MTDGPETSSTDRPYGPPANVTTVLARLRSRNLVERIDIDYLRDAGVPDGTASRTLSGLKFLGLVTPAGAPTTELRAIHTATDEEYRQILSGLVKRAYADVFEQIVPAEDTQDRILNFFRRYTPASQRARMVIFFLGMCREAGIPTLDTPRQRKMATGQTRQPTAAKKPTVVTGRVGRASAITPMQPLDTDMHPALAGLMRSLPAVGTFMSKDQREQWLAMASATLAFLYPTTFPYSVDEPTGDSGEEGGFDDE